MKAYFFANMLLGGLMLACSSVEKPHSVSPAPLHPGAATVAASDASPHNPGDVAAIAGKTPVPADAQDAVSTPAASSNCGPGCICGAACNCKTPLECLQVAAASPPAPVSSPALAPALPAATGHYELRSVRFGLRNWQNQWVWIPNQARQPVYQYQTYGGGCANGRCGR